MKKKWSIQWEEKVKAEEAYRREIWLFWLNASQWPYDWNDGWEINKLSVPEDDKSLWEKWPEREEKRERREAEAGFEEGCYRNTQTYLLQCEKREKANYTTWKLLYQLKREAEKTSSHHMIPLPKSCLSKKYRRSSYSFHTLKRLLTLFYSSPVSFLHHEEKTAKLEKKILQRKLPTIWPSWL